MVHVRRNIIKEAKYLKLIKRETPQGKRFEIYEKQNTFKKLIGIPEIHATFFTFKKQKEAEKEFNKLEKQYEKFEMVK